MIGIGAIATYVPEGRIENRTRLAEFNVTEDFVNSKIGVEAVARKAADEDTADLCAKAFAALVAEHGLKPAEIDCVVVCTQNPQGSGLPHTSAVLQGRLGLPRSCACWDISLGCTGFAHGLAIVQAFMEAQGLKSSVLFTADPYSKIIDPADRNTAMIFGDGACATWLVPSTPERPLFAPVATRFHTEGERCGALENRAGTLHMDGRAVFNFSATAVPQQIAALLQAAGLALGDVDLFLLHQGSKYIVDTIRKRLGLEEARVPLALARTGNLVSSSIPAMLQRYLGNPDIRRIVLSGFGVGLASASCVLERRPKPDAADAIAKRRV
jgi:3-oxoacyl-[acyl-carrier-protein] synthase-3